MARGRTLGKMLRMALVCLTIGVLLGMSPALVNPAADGYEPGDTLGGAAPISTDTMELMPQASISGVVKDGSEAPIVGAMVSALSVLFPFPAYDDTGADGSYSISISMPGNYVVWAQASGFVTEYYNNVYDPSLATEVASGATNIDFTLGLAGSISGVVKDGAGNPIQSALVNAEDDDFTGYDYTGADGTYSIAGLTPDSYVVWAEANGYTTEYYNNVYDRLSATPVEVTPSSDKSGIDFTLGVPDVTPPTTPVVTDDGATTTSTSQLHATWSSSDPESGISEYQYAIGTTSGGTDMVAWTSAGTNTQVTKTGLSLTVGTTYYFSVKARNGAAYGVESG